VSAAPFPTSIVKVSLELRENAGFDLESYLKQKFPIRLGRSPNNKFTAGVEKPAKPE
jgi:HK97 family phage major capsid protein